MVKRQSYAGVPAQAPAVVGRRELLAFASACAGRRVARFEDLKDGSVLLKLFERTWPAAAQRRKKLNSRSAVGNWEVLKAMFHELGLPMKVYDPKGIQAAQFRPAYSVLVLVYFLNNLARKHDFSVDFAHAIDPALAEFLQSPASIQTLVKGGSLTLTQQQQQQQLLGPPPGPAGEENVEPRQDGTEKSPEKAVSPTAAPSAGPAQSPPTALTDRTLPSGLPRPSPAKLSPAGPGLSPAGTPAASAVEEQREPPTQQGEAAPVRRVTFDVDSSPSGVAATEPTAGSSWREEPAWASTSDRVQGEALLTELRFETDGLRRALQAARHEREFLVARHESDVAELRSASEAELTFRTDALRNEASVRLLGLQAERANDQRRFVAELRKVWEEVAQCSPAAGGAEGVPDDAAASQLVELSKSQVISRRQVDALTDRVKWLDAETDELRRQLGAQQEYVSALHAHYMGPGTAGADPGPERGPSRRERELAAQLAKAQDEMKNRELAHVREVAELRAEAHQRGAGGMPADGDTFGMLLQGLGTERELARLREECGTLRSANEFLRRQASRLFGSGAADAGPSPSPGRGDAAQDSEPAPQDGPSAEETTREWEELVDAGSLLVELDRLAADGVATDSLSGLFWRLSASLSVSREAQRQSAARASAAEEEALAARAARDDERNAARAAAERATMEARAAAAAAAHERAEATVRVALAEDSVADALADAAEARAQTVATRRETAAMLEGRFSSLTSAVKESREECAKLRLRERHWVSLIECHRAAAALAERRMVEAAGPQAVARGEHWGDAREERVRLESEAALHVDAINAVRALLPSSEEVAPSSYEQAVKDAAAELHEQVAEAERTVEELRRRLARKTEDAASLALRARRHELRADEEAAARRRLEADAEFAARTAASERAAAELRDRDAQIEIRCREEALTSTRAELERLRAAVRAVPSLAEAVFAAVGADDDEPRAAGRAADLDDDAGAVLLISPVTSPRSTSGEEPAGPAVGAIEEGEAAQSSCEQDEEEHEPDAAGPGPEERAAAVTTSATSDVADTPPPPPPPPRRSEDEESLVSSTGSVGSSGDVVGLEQARSEEPADSASGELEDDVGPRDGASVSGSPRARLLTDDAAGAVAGLVGMGGEAQGG